MLVISGTITIDPSNNARMAEATSTLVAETIKEDGCNVYEYSQSAEHPGVWRVFEEWASEDAVNAHIASPHMAAFMGAAGELGITGVDIKRYDIESVSKFM